MLFIVLAIPTHMEAEKGKILQLWKCNDLTSTFNQNIHIKQTEFMYFNSMNLFSSTLEKSININELLWRHKKIEFNQYNTQSNVKKYPWCLYEQINFFFLVTFGV